MVNRNSPFDDELGAAEGNNEGKELNILHRLLFEKISQDNPNDNLQYRVAQNILDSPPIIIELKPKVEGMTFKLKTNSLTTKSGDSNFKYHWKQGYIRFDFDTVTGRDMYVRVYNMHPTASKMVNVADFVSNLFESPIESVKEVPIDLNWSLEELAKAETEWPKIITIPQEISHTADLPSDYVYDIQKNSVRAFAIELKATEGL